ncbi:uncharacterized protein A4U43_C05F2930 [Asparagus officinalis]|uniref:Uncharacterized protein n=1 Tax=Asparagus officinalis TaxID=4686 RepID=A0A5P1ET43_ASPOF|nr:uncharacterized protein A4U43_C05F2930 [Asparagus officinalis]
MLLNWAIDCAAAAVDLLPGPACPIHPSPAAAGPHPEAPSGPRLRRRLRTASRRTRGSELLLLERRVQPRHLPRRRPLEVLEGGARARARAGVGVLGVGRGELRGGDGSEVDGGGLRGDLGGGERVRVRVRVLGYLGR